MAQSHSVCRIRPPAMTTSQGICPGDRSNVDGTGLRRDVAAEPECVLQLGTELGDRPVGRGNDDTSEPVNFSAVLYDDGRILYQYGAGNNNVANSTLFGCATSTPVVGISAGRDSYQLRYENYDGLPSLERANSVLIDPPFNNPSDPVVRIETRK